MKSNKTLYEIKTALLKELITNQNEQVNNLEFGRPDKAVKMTLINERLIKKMEKVDKELEKTADSLPGTSGSIALTDEIFKLNEEARMANELITDKMEEYLQEMKSEYTTVSVKRQLHKFLHKPEKIWKTGTC